MARGTVSFVFDVLLMLLNMARFASSISFLAVMMGLGEFSAGGKVLLVLFVVAHLFDRGFCFVQGRAFLRRNRPANLALFGLAVLVGGSRALFLRLYPYGFKEEMLRRQVSLVSLASTVAKLVLLVAAFVEAINLCNAHPLSSACLTTPQNGGNIIKWVILRQAITLFVLAYVSGFFLALDLCIDFCCGRYSRLKRDHDDERRRQLELELELAQQPAPSNGGGGDSGPDAGAMAADAASSSTKGSSSQTQIPPAMPPTPQDSTPK
nr:hypothetical protein HK105_007775 [Polyrhizophydium stewartii]